MINSESLSGLVDAALEISNRRRAILERMREAFELGKDQEALSLAKELCGVNNEQESNRADSRLN
jgi:hypothetical protein